MTKKVVELPVQPKQDFCHIQTFMHCSACLAAMPPDTSPMEWARTQTGFTQWGVQVWCNRCNRSVGHFDFMGQRVASLPDSLPKDATPQDLSEPQLVSLTYFKNKRARGRLTWVLSGMSDPQTPPEVPQPTNDGTAPALTPGPGDGGPVPS